MQYIDHNQYAPVCGHKKEVRKREITYEDGELVKMKKELKLDEGDPIIEKSTGAKLYFYAWDDDQKKIGFQFSLNVRIQKLNVLPQHNLKIFVKKTVCVFIQNIQIMQRKNLRTSF